MVRAAAARRGHRYDLKAPVCTLYGCAHDCIVIGKILHRHISARLVHGRHYCLSHRTTIECIRTLLGYQPERSRKFRVAEYVARLQRQSIAEIGHFVGIMAVASFS